MHAWTSAIYKHAPVGQSIIIFTFPVNFNIEWLVSEIAPIKNSWRNRAHAQFLYCTVSETLHAFPLQHTFPHIVVLRSMKAQVTITPPTRSLRKITISYRARTKISDVRFFIGYPKCRKSKGKLSFALVLETDKGKRFILQCRQTDHSAPKALRTLLQVYMYLYSGFGWRLKMQQQN